ncbi:MAG: hypothetical protein GY788_29255 [bacterium]|nr:hypothetical protein [bacterium]
MGLTIDSAVTNLLGAILRVADELDAPSATRSFLREIGVVLDNDPQSLPTGGLQALADALDVLVAAVEEGSPKEVVATLVASLACTVELVSGTVSFFESLDAEVPSDDHPGFAGAPELALRLLNYAISEYLQQNASVLFEALRLTGLLELREHEQDLSKGVPAHTRRLVHWALMPGFVSDPIDHARTAYGWDSASFQYEALLTRLRTLLMALGVWTDIEYANTTFSVAIDDPGAPPSNMSQVLRIPLLDIGSETGLDIQMYPVHDAGGRVFGLAFVTNLGGALQASVQLSDQATLSVLADAGPSAGLAIVTRPGLATDFIAGALSDDNNRLAPQPGWKVAGVVKLDPGSEQLTVPVVPDILVLSLGMAVASLSIESLRSGVTEVLAETAIEGGVLEIKPSSVDSFLASLLPSDGFALTFDVAIGFSNISGFHLRGSGGLDVTVPLHDQIGPLTLESIYLAVEIRERGLGGTFAATVSAELGPIAVTISRLGVRIGLAPDPPTSDEGPALDFGFLPPTGVGFAVDGGGLVGGGFIDFFPEKGRYSGALALQFGEIGITAIGLITTGTADGSEGFSLLVSINVIFNPGIQLSMGFTLSGVGGLVGINRRLQVDVLREGLKTGALESILFPPPKDVIPKAAQILSDMEAVFPAEEGRFVVGPMVRFGWGTPTVIVAELGVFFDLFDPVRIALMGQAVMSLPDPAAPLVTVNIDVLGTVDFEKKELSFQAAISGKTLVFELFGDIALLLTWSSQPEMALAIGGFHPAFDPPAPPAIFSGLRRLGVNVNYGPVIQLGCSGYLAITPNTLQFGARVDVMIGLRDVDIGIRGFLSFDALINFSPFGFEARVGSGMSVNVAGVPLADVKLLFVLAGPAPWNIRGTASVRVLFVEIPIEFDVTFGEDGAPERDAIDPWPRLEKALRSPTCWGSQLPSSVQHVEALSDISEQPGIADDDSLVPRPLVLHPASTLEVRQNVVPLDTTLEKFGNAPVEGYDRFRIASVTLEDGCPDGVDLKFVTIDEQFARAQFEEMSDSEKLSLPSFEPMPGGITTRSSTHVKASGAMQREPVTYESIVIKSDGTSTDPKDGASSWAEARLLLSGSAAHRAARRLPRSRFANAGAGPIGTLAEKYTIVDSETLVRVVLDERVDVPDGRLTRVQADQALAHQLSLHPDKAGSLIVVPEYEAEGLS